VDAEGVSLSDPGQVVEQGPTSHEVIFSMHLQKPDVRSGLEHLVKVLGF
jgi:hypothetical protein